MTSPIIIGILVFIGIAGLVLAVGAMFNGSGSEKLENRLDALTGKGARTKGGVVKSQASLLTKPLEGQDPVIDRLLRHFNLGLMIEQADASFTLTQLGLVSVGLGCGGCVLAAVIGVPLFAYMLILPIMGSIPFLWLMWKRSSRMKKFSSQLPEAMELMARALRSGQSLPASFLLVGKEMQQPICQEFGRVAEEQNFGVSLDESLDSLAERIPNLDLRFFVTAVTLQRQTGGDLAEILDKIGYLVRERFKILGLVQALTGEGRLSGSVLLGMPFVLFLVMLKINPTYIMALVDEPLGRQMIAFALVMQTIGAIAIKKIITIKV